MNIGVPRERKRDERRVSIRPEQAKVLCQDGHRVFVENGAGEAVGFSDEAYAQAGAMCVPQEVVYKSATLLLKVKCPLPEEYSLLRAHHILFCYLHFDENISPDRIQQIVATGVTGLAYEWVQKGDDFPLLRPMSELTGAVFARKSMSLLMEHKGVLGGRYLPVWPPASVMVIGVGHIGANAINLFARNQFRLIIVDKHPESLSDRVRRYVPESTWNAAPKMILPFDESDPDASVARLRDRVPDADIVICSAVRRPTLPKDRCEYLISRKDVAAMSKNSIICDATACVRDFIETCIPSDSLSETYMEEGVIHYNCDHIPSLVAATATVLLTEATFPYVRTLCSGFEGAVRQDGGLAKGVMCYLGKVTHAYSAEKKKLRYTSLCSMFH